MGVPVAKAVEVGLMALDAIMALTQKAQVAGQAVARAQADGRSELTDAEWAAIKKTAEDPLEELRQTLASMP